MTSSPFYHELPKNYMNNIGGQTFGQHHPRSIAQKPNLLPLRT